MQVPAEGSISFKSLRVKLKLLSACLYCFCFIFEATESIFFRLHGSEQNSKEKEMLLGDANFCASAVESFKWGGGLLMVVMMFCVCICKGCD